MNLQKSTGQCPQSSKTNSPFSVFGVRECNQNYSSNAANKNTKLRIHRNLTIISDSFRHLSVLQSVILMSKVESMALIIYNAQTPENTARIKTSQPYQKMNLGKFFNSEFLAVSSLFAQAYIHSCSPKWVENISSPLRMQWTCNEHKANNVTGENMRKCTWPKIA